MRRAWLLLCLVGISSSGCKYLFAPRPEDAPALKDFHSQLTRGEGPVCAHVISLLEPGQVTRPYKVILSLSATCSPGSVQLCEDRLIERACRLGADAVVLDGVEDGASPPGASPQSLVSRGGRAIRWVDATL
jgi:hypothetical protein